MGLMNLRRENPNNYFALAVENKGRKVVGDMVKETLENRDRRFDTPRDNRRTGSFREPRNADLEIDRGNIYEGYSNITRKVKVDVLFFDGKIDVTTFSDWIVAIEDYLDWYEMYDIERFDFLIRNS